MLRRALLFVVLFTGGVALLTFLVGGDDLFVLGRAETKTTGVRRPPPGGITIKSEEGKRPPSSAGIPETWRITTGGRGKIEPLQPPVRLPSGEVLNVPKFRLEWRDAEPRPDGIYRLSGADLVVYGKVDPGRPRATPVAHLHATWMDVAAALEDQAFTIDEQHAMDMHEVVLDVMAAGVEEAADAKAAGIGGLRLETDRLRAHVGRTRLELRTDPAELVTITSRAAAGQGPPLLVTGHGLDADLATGGRGLARGAPEKGGAPAEPAKRPSWAVLATDIVVRGLAADGAADDRFTLRGGGPLKLLVASDDVWTLDLREDVVFHGRASAAAAGPRTEVVATGSRLHAWFRRGRLAAARPARRGAPALTDATISGTDGRPSELVLGGQRVRAGAIEVVFDAFGQPAGVTAIGAPELDMGDAAGHPLGRLSATDRIRWLRPGRRAATMLGAFGFDLASELAAIPIGHPVFPLELIHVTGPATFRPFRKDGPIRSGRASGGLLVHLTRRLGAIEPFLVLGLGDVELRGVLAGREPTPFVARGNRGFAVSRDPGTAFLRACLGPSTPDARHAFTVDAGPDHVSGKGWVFLDATDAAITRLLEPAAEAGPGPAAALAARFVAGVGETLTWKRVAAGDVTEVAGVKSAVLRRQPGRPDSLFLGGLPVRLTSPDGVVARAELVERQGGGPWILRKSFAAVRLLLPSGHGRPPAKLRADHVAVWQRPAWVPRVDARAEVWLRARGHVHAETTRESDGLHVELTCNSLTRWPWFAPPVVASILRGTSGGAGVSLDAALFGGEHGVFTAAGNVVVVATERARQGRAAAAVRRVEGETLFADLDRGLGSFVLLPGPGALVRARIEEPGRGTLRLAGDRLVGRGGELVLGGRTAGAPLVWLDDERRGSGSGTTARRLRLRASGPVRWADRLLRFPGPVLVQSVDAADVPIAGGFFLKSGDELRVELGPPAAAAGDTRGWELPGSVERLVAGGGVRMGYGKVTALGSVLSFAPGTGWLELVSRNGLPVVVRLDGVRMESYPRIAVNLATRELEAGRGSGRGVFQGMR